MQDPRCPNCRYVLVLIDRRMKYKCSKCGKLFPQKDIEDQNFREWNKSQRLLDKTTLRKPRIKLTEEERKERRKESFRKWRENHKEEHKELSEKNYYVNRDKILARMKIYRQEIKEDDRIRRKSHRLQNLDRTRQVTRINFWRAKQKALTLRTLENMGEKGYNADIFNSPPTWYLTNY